MGVLCIFVPALLLADADNVGVPDSGVELGLGWDSQLARVVANRCLEFAPVQERGQTLNLTMTEVSDTSDVMDTLNVSAGMSIRTMFGSGSAQAEFATTSNVNSSSNSLLIRATVSNGVLFVGPSRPLAPSRAAFPELDSSEKADPDAVWFLGEEKLNDEILLTDDAVDLIGNGSADDLREFERHCGDSFVSAIYSGAELIAITSFSATKSSVANAVMTELKGEFSAFGAQGDATAKMNAESKAEVANTQLDVSYTQIGGAGGIIPTEKSAFINKLETLPLEAMQGPQFHTMDVTPYTELANWPQRIALDVGDDPTEAALTNYYWTFTSIEGVLQEILNNRTNYLIEAGREAKLESLQDDINRLRQDIYRVLQRTHALAGKDSEYQVFFGFISRRDEVLQAKLDALEADQKALHQRLVDYSFGLENPNVVKLLLPLPMRDLSDEEEGMRRMTDLVNRNPMFSAELKQLFRAELERNIETLGEKPFTAEEVVLHYVAPQSRRVCRTSPVSPECMANTLLGSLEACVPSGPEWAKPESGCWRSE